MSYNCDRINCLLIKSCAKLTSIRSQFYVIKCLEHILILNMLGNIFICVNYCSKFCEGTAFLPAMLAVALLLELVLKYSNIVRYFR